MDKYIVTAIHPFVLGQEIYVYIAGECVQILECTLEDMCDKLYMLCEKYDITNVHIHGGQLYALKWKNDFIANKFGKRNIQIHIH